VSNLPKTVTYTQISDPNLISLGALPGREKDTVYRKPGEGRLTEDLGVKLCETGANSPRLTGAYGKFEAKASPFRAGMKPTNSIQPPTMA